MTWGGREDIGEVGPVMEKRTLEPCLSWSSLRGLCSFVFAVLAFTPCWVCSLRSGIVLFIFISCSSSRLRWLMAITFSNQTITVASRRAPCLQSSLRPLLDTVQHDLVLELPGLVPGCSPDTMRALLNWAQTKYFVSHVSCHLYAFPNPQPLHLCEGNKQNDGIVRAM